jgi:hypothetical protein
MLTHWQVDPDLAGLREPSGLEKLSADEQEKWTALWNEVSAVLNRLQNTKSFSRSPSSQETASREGDLLDVSFQRVASHIEQPYDRVGVISPKASAPAGRK